MFYDRTEAGERLADSLKAYEGRPGAVVLAIPRGGVVLGDVISRRLRLPLDVILTKKIGHPGNPECAIGVVSLTGASVDEEAVLGDLIPRSYIDAEILRIRSLLMSRYRSYRGAAAPIPLRGKTALVVDDGIATGNTMLEAARVARAEGASEVVAAVPVGPARGLDELRGQVDALLCLETPKDLLAIGRHYTHFEPVEDGEALRILRRASGRGRFIATT